MKEFTIDDLMQRSGVAFGTSGARGLAEDMTDRVCYVYTMGFLQYLESEGELPGGETEVAVAGDLRPSTDRIMQAVCRAAADRGYRPVNCGKIPSPAVALYGLVHRVPAIMVTGSHIPADRNGIKFNRCSGEILKPDEAGIRRQTVRVDDGVFSERGAFLSADTERWPETMQAREAYVARYLDVFPSDCLQGKRIGVYQHSAVGRDLLLEIYRGLGAETVPLGRSEDFVPVDTEAIRPEDVRLAARWAAEASYVAILSTDGDSDRPLIADERGQWLRGDVAGILCARYLGADAVSTPVSCNTALEKSGLFARVDRTRIGSPYVISSMQQASRAGCKRVVGYEANGGFLLQSECELYGRRLSALPTRDAVILHLALLLLAEREGKRISELVATLPRRFTASDRLQEISQTRSHSLLERFRSGRPAQDCEKGTDIFGSLCGVCRDIDHTDGVRMTFDSEEIIHLRPSGNAPELRCYTETASPARAAELNVACLKILRSL